MWIQLDNAGTFDAALNPSDFGTAGIQGTSQADTIYGTDGSDLLRGGGGGQDALFGRGGDDQFFLGGDYADGSTIVAHQIDGGTGIDTLTLDFSSERNFDLGNSISGVERIVGKNYNDSSERSISMSAAVWNQLTEYAVENTNNNRPDGRITVQGDGAALNLSAIANSLHLGSFTLNGAADSLDVGDFTGRINAFQIDDAEQVGTIAGGDQTETWNLTYQAGQTSSINFTAGESGSTVNLKTTSQNTLVALNGSISGGVAADTVVVQAGQYDLSEVTFTGVEQLTLSSNSTSVLSQTQVDSLTLSGSGTYFVKTPNGDLSGTSNDDTYKGTGLRPSPEVLATTQSPGLILWCTAATSASTPGNEILTMAAKSLSSTRLLVSMERTH